MEDNQLLAHIKELTTEEETLYQKENLDEGDVKRLHSIQSHLEESWDFLRQRRALRDAGQNPDQAEKRDIDTINGYVD